MALLEQFGDKCEETVRSRFGDVKLLRLARPDRAQMVSKSCDLWAYVWASSSVAADVVCRMVSNLATSSSVPDIVELGCGTGLCSLQVSLHAHLLSSRLGTAPCRVMATDLVPSALDLVAHNGKLNAIPQGVLATHTLDWGREDDADLVAASLNTPVLSGTSPPPLIVVAADVLFSTWTVRPVLRSIATLLRSRPYSVCVLADPGRPPRDDVAGIVADVGLAVHSRVDGTALSLPSPLPALRECTVFVMTLADHDNEGVETRTANLSAQAALVEAAAVATRARLQCEAECSSALHFAHCLPPVKQ